MHIASGKRVLKYRPSSPFLSGIPMIFRSASATSVASAAFLGITKYSEVMVFTLVLLMPCRSSSKATFAGRTPVSIPRRDGSR